MKLLYQIETLQIPNSQQVRAARALLGLTQAEISKIAGIALSTIKKYEALGGDEEPLLQLSFRTVEKLVNFYKEQGVEFTISAERVSVTFQRSRLE